MAFHGLLVRTTLRCSYQIHTNLLQRNRFIHTSIGDEFVQSKDNIKRVINHCFFLDRSSIFRNNYSSVKPIWIQTLGKHVQSFQIFNYIARLCRHYKDHQMFKRLVYISAGLPTKKTTYLTLFASTKVCCLFVSPNNLGKTARIPYELETTYSHPTSARVRFIFTYCLDISTRPLFQSIRNPTFPRLCQNSSKQNDLSMRWFFCRLLPCWNSDK